MNTQVLKRLLLLFALFWGTALSHAELAPMDQRVTRLETEIRTLQQQEQERNRLTVWPASAGALAILFGAFCALWAQNTKRHSLLWFLFGLFFNVVAVMVLLVKNSDDRFNQAQRERFTGGRARR